MNNQPSRPNNTGNIPYNHNIYNSRGNTNTNLPFPINNQNSRIDPTNIQSPYMGLDQMPRYPMPNQYNPMFTPHMTHENFIPQFQLFMKWRNQMTQQILRTRQQQQYYNPYSFIDPTQRSHKPIVPMHPVPLSQHSSLQTMGSPGGYPPYNRDPMRRIQTLQNPHKSVVQPLPQFNQNGLMMLKEQKRKQVQKQKQKRRLLNLNKIPDVIVIDQQDQQIPNIPIQKKISPVEIQQAPSQKIVRVPKPIDSSSLIGLKAKQHQDQKKLLRSQKQKDDCKTNIQKHKKIQKRRQQKQKIRHRQTQREKAIKQKKLEQEEKIQLSKPINLLGKIGVSSYHQAKIPQFKCEFQQQKNQRKINLISRLQYKGSQGCQQYKIICSQYAPQQVPILFQSIVSSHTPSSLKFRVQQTTEQNLPSKLE